MPDRRSCRAMLSAVVVVACFLFASVSAASAATVVNGDFETGNLSGWTVSNSSFAPYPCGWFAYSGASTPVTGLSISAPPQGRFAAVTDQTGPCSSVLYQEVALAASSTHTLSLFVYYHNDAGAFATPSSLSEGYPGPNQQYRIDVMKPGTDPRSLAASDVLANVFATHVGDPLSLGPTKITYDLTPFAGQTVRLRFAMVDNVFFFRAATDAVSIASHPFLACSPAPVPIGGSVTCRVVVTNSSPGPTATGTVSFSVKGAGGFSPGSSCTLSSISATNAGCQVTFTPAGTGPAVVSAHYPGDGGHAAAGGQFTVFVNNPSSTTVACVPSPVTVGQPTTCTATVSDTGSSKVTPTGFVSFTSSPTTGAFAPASGQCLLSATATPGVASCQLTFTPSATGPHVLTGAYSGDPVHTTSSGSASVTAT